MIASVSAYLEEVLIACATVEDLFDEYFLIGVRELVVSE